MFVDGIRGLPDSAGASRVTVRLYAQGENIGEEVKICAADGKRFTPKFDLVAEFRRPAFDPTSTLLIRIDALDEDLPSGRKARCLGYTLLNLFHAPGDNKAQPADEQSQGYCLNQGGWQLPIYTRPHPHIQTLRWDDLNNNKKWLGCSVLVRVQPAPTSSDGLEVLSRATVPKPRWAAVWNSKFHGAVDLHAIGAPPTHWLISTQVGRAGSRFAGAAV